jgi:hypothetical protein
MVGTEKDAAYIAAANPATILSLIARIEELEAKVDSLMLEWCPDEMTPEQIEKWGSNQRPCAAEIDAALNAALGRPADETGG